jgi:hypothetical protein
MKRLHLLTAFCALASTAFAQDPVKKDSAYNSAYNDTIRIGSILIIKKNKKAHDTDTMRIVTDNRSQNRSRITTNYGILDLGFANYNDETNYATAGSFLVNRPGSPPLSSADLKLRAGKSMNVNIWFFMQRLSLVKRNVNLKYGLGLELNNYRFRSPISFKENGTLPYSGGQQTNSPFVFRDSISFSKNKLAADYLTVPIMVNLAANRKGKNFFSASFGISAGYLYSQRNKQISDERGKQKNKGDYDMEKFKISYVGEVGLGPVLFYGSYSPKSIIEKSLDLRPYNFGIRFSNW